jgi:hypothetical protein
MVILRLVKPVEQRMLMVQPHETMLDEREKHRQVLRKLSDPRSELRWDLALTFRLLLQQRRRKRNGVQSMPM